MQFAGSLGISKRDFYTKIGVSRGTLESNTGITEDIIAKFIAAYPNVNVDWLITGYGEIYNTSKNVVPRNIITPVHQPRYFEKKEENQSIPLYDFKATAGLRELFDNGNNKAIDSILIPNAPKCDGAIRIIGDSMNPILRSGDIILYKEVPVNLQDVFYGEMYLISYAIYDEFYTVVKYIKKSTQGEPYITLASENPAYPDKDIDFRRINALALVKASVNVSTME